MIETAWEIMVVSWELVIAVGAWVCIYYLVRGAMDADKLSEDEQMEEQPPRTRPRKHIPSRPAPPPPGGTVEEHTERIKRA